MKTKKLIESLRVKAQNLTLDHSEVFHAEGGFCGIMADLHRASSPTALSQDTLESFWTQFLCTNGQPEDGTYNPFCTPGFSFNAAVHPGTVTIEHERTLDGVAISFLYGSPKEMLLLSRLIAAPMIQHVRKYTGLGCGRSDSYYDTDMALVEWAYMMYDLGLKLDIPALRRCYRLISAFDANNEAGDKNCFLCGFSDTNPIYKNAWPDVKQWDILWAAAQRNELAYSKLGTDLFSATQIALDYLVEYDFAVFAAEFEHRQQSKSVSKRQRDSRNIAIGRLKEELRQHLRSAKSHAITTREQGDIKLLPRPSQKQLAKIIGVSASTVCRCLEEGNDKELLMLWDTANDLAMVQRYRG